MDGKEGEKGGLEELSLPFKHCWKSSNRSTQHQLFPSPLLTHLSPSKLISPESTSSEL